MRESFLKNHALVIAVMLAFMFFALSLYGCGKKGNPVPSKAFCLQMDEPDAAVF
jgi:hypothetical protein